MMLRKTSAHWPWRMRLALTTGGAGRERAGRIDTAEAAFGEAEDAKGLMEGQGGALF